ncbi:hypothetical protein ACFSKN_14855 [Mariniflexile gromovii]|uniref:Uncharacterized protein n=1 Tax=Mariniflexile gromovii TaxID=362523 RepID=A0ABS4BRP1_9FLAO|nr:hypothetical protein [Mariniflexile gromovii]MBP0903246.1 hypothetical protein [Mariniflexile gromovii]
MKINKQCHQLFCFLVFLFSFSITSQNTCNTYYPFFKEGVQFEITNYNAKGKKENVSISKIQTIESNVTTDEKGKLMGYTELTSITK